MAEFFQFASLVNAIIFPLIGGTVLLLSKLTVGEAARRAERRFLATLVVITIVTLRTVITCDDVWLVHTATLSLLILGALLIPHREASIAV